MTSQTINLLLADDDDDDCMFFKEALDELSLSTNLSVVNDGEQLMNLLIKEERVLDVLFLDLNMPRKNGFDCLAEIKENERLKNIPVIIFSTSFNAEVVELLYDKGANYYIRKPAYFSDLKKVISHALDLIVQNPNERPPKELFVLHAI
jgi:CheY-like chemotaxis protein